MRILAVLVITWLLAGCQVLKAVKPDGGGAEIKHDSALLAGRPIEAPRGPDGKGREDRLDVVSVYLFWERDTPRVQWYTETGVGYRLKDDGFYVRRDRLPLIFNGRTGVRFRFTKR